MKFEVGSKENGYIVKHAAERILAEEGVLTLGALKQLLPIRPIIEDSDKYLGWYDYVRTDKKIRVRQTKAGWFIYFPEAKALEVVDITDMVYSSDYDPNRCRVISKPKKNVVKEEFGYSHGCFQLKFVKADGTEIAYPVFVVEMDDGTVRQVKPENIIFGSEE